MKCFHNLNDLPSGIVGIILRFLTPLTIAPAVSMIGLSLFHAASDMGEKNWAAYIGFEIVSIDKELKKKLIYQFIQGR